jgi:nucleoside-diphosphate-sugar epimerase
MVYGPKVPIPMKETGHREPVGPYGRSKVECEDLCAAARKHLPLSILRPSVILGPGRLGILTKLFDQIRRHQTVWMIGTGENRHHMIEVGDCAAACILAIDRSARGTYNLGTEKPLPTRELLAEVCRRAGSRSRIRGLPDGPARLALRILHALKIGPMNPEQFEIAPVDYVLDITAAKTELGWAPVRTDADALHASYLYYLELLERGR